MMTVVRVLVLILWAGAALAGDGMPWSPAPAPEAAYARARQVAELGRKLFFDPGLSASGRMACATCHDPAHAFSGPVMMGGPRLDQPGARAAPGLTYGFATPPFTEHFHESEDEGDEGVDQGPTGGRDWDGRVDRARDQAALPLLSINEMANGSRAAVVRAARRAAYARDVERLYGRGVWRNTNRAFSVLGEALEAFEETPSVFGSFSSKYDAYLRGAAELSPAEARGLAVFNDPDRGNCTRCHPSGVSADGKPPLFTDFGYAALGVPRNPAIAANADPGYFDLGLCGPERKDFAGKGEYCGLFKTPTLRNAALKVSFFHNGAVGSLRDAVAFYATRDSAPGTWYSGRKFDDFPERYAGNVDAEAPFGPRRILSDADVDDLVVFLGTLVDDWTPPPRPGGRR